MLNTHKKINNRFSGKVVKISKDYAKVVLHTNIDMVADKQGLIHGGFAFSAADFCAMATINEPNVVLVASEVRFLAPVKLGDVIVFEGKTIWQKEPKAEVEVVGKVDNKKVFSGIFKTYVTKQHILEK